LGRIAAPVDSLAVLIAVPWHCVSWLRTVTTAPQRDSKTTKRRQKKQQPYPIFADETDGIPTYFVIFILQLRPKLKRYPNTNDPIESTKKKLIMRSSDADSDSSSAP
jgi:hypothetical protein